VRGLHEAMESHLAKYRSLMPSLGLLFALIDGSSSVGLSHAQLAAGWCAYLESHAAKMYQKLSGASTDGAKRLAQKIVDGGLPDRFTGRDVYMKKGWGGLDTPERVQHAASILDDLNWIRTVHLKETGGRPGTHYMVNPKVRRKTDAK
jgi:putative DNA primase/helicase